MDVSKMSTEELEALRKAMEGSVMSPDVVPLTGDRKNVKEALIGHFPVNELGHAVDLTVARTFKGDDDTAVGNVLAKSLGTNLLYDIHPETGNRTPYVMYKGEPYYINKPGLSMADAENVVANVAGFIPAGKFAMAGKTLPKQAMRAATGGGATSLAGDVAVGEMGGGTDVDYEKAGITAATSPIAQVIGAKLFPLLHKPLVNVFGNLTPEGAKALEAAGLNPAVFTKDGLAKLNEAYKRLGADFQGDAAAAIGTKVQGEQFGIPTTLGQQTGDVRQIAREQAMRNQARGEAAGKRMTAFDQEQAAKVQGAAAREQGRLSATGAKTGNPAPAFESEYDAGAAIGANVKRASDALKGEIDTAYQSAADRSLAFKGASINDLKSQVESAVHAADVTLKPDLTPASIAAIERVKGIKNSIQQKTSSPGIPGGMKTVFEDVDFRDLETTRRQLNGLMQAAKNPADRRGVQIAIREFDTWIDSAVDKGLARGDQDAIKALKDARALRTKYGTQFEDRSWDADAGRVMEKLVNSDVTPNEVANLLIGYGEAGQTPVTTRVAARLKDIFGAGSPEWNQVRELAFMRIVNGPKGTPSGYQAIVSRFDKALQGQGESYMRALYTPEEITRMRQFRDAIGRLVPPRTASNPSGSGYEVARMFDDFASKLLGTKAAMTGDPVAAAGALGLKGGKSLLNSRAATKAAEGVTIPPGRGYAVAPGLGAAAGEEARRRVNEFRQEKP